MKYYGIVRVINEDNKDKALKLVEGLCEEFSNEYRTANYNVEVTRDIKAREFLTNLDSDCYTEEETKEWLEKHNLEEIYERYTEDGLDEYARESFSKIWGEEFASFVFIDEIKVYEKDSELWFKIYFDINPGSCLWGSAYITDLETNKSGIKTSDISDKIKNEEFAYIDLVLDANGERDEYGRLFPIETISGVTNNNRLLCINDTIEKCSVKENDYVFYLEVYF